MLRRNHKSKERLDKIVSRLNPQSAKNGSIYIVEYFRKPGEPNTDKKEPASCDCYFPSMKISEKSSSKRTIESVYNSKKQSKSTLSVDYYARKIQKMELEEAIGRKKKKKMLGKSSKSRRRIHEFVDRNYNIDSINLRNESLDNIMDFDSIDNIIGNSGSNLRKGNRVGNWSLDRLRSTNKIHVNNGGGFNNIGHKDDKSKINNYGFDDYKGKSQK